MSHIRRIAPDEKTVRKEIKQLVMEAEDLRFGMKVRLRL